MPSEKNESPLSTPLHLSSEMVYRGYFDLKKERLRHPNGSERDYTSLHVGWNAAVVLAQDQQGRYILNREYRPPAKEHLLGPPGGTLEVGEDPRVGAQREFYEETGYWAEELTPLGCSYPLPGVCNQKIYFFYAQGAIQKNAQSLDPFEFIKTELLSESELKDLLRSSSAVDGMLCTALWYKSLLSC